MLSISPLLALIAANATGPFFGTAQTKLLRLPEIERQHRLAVRQCRLDLLDRRRLRRDQIGICGETLADFLSRLEPIGAQRVDRSVDRLDALVVALSRRQRQHVVQRPELSIHLLAEVLLLAHQLGQRRILGRGARARRRQRLLHRAAANGVGKAEGFGADIAGRFLVPRQHVQVGFHDALQALAARGDRCGVVVIGVLARGRHQDRNRRPELADRFLIAPSPHQADRQRAARRGSIEMTFPDPGNLPLHELFGCRDSGLDLARGVERGNPSAVEFEGQPPRGLPVGDCLVDLREDRDPFLAFALQVEDIAELRQQLHPRKGILGDADGLADLQ